MRIVLFFCLFGFTAFGVSIEKDAIINSALADKAPELAKIIKMYGYRCDSISVARPFMVGRGFTLVCNNYAYEYDIEDKGGRWRVTVK